MIKSQQDFFSGLMFTLVGGGFAWGATNYTIGTGARMGPGYFPLLLGIFLAVLGAFITFFSLLFVAREFYDPDDDPNATPPTNGPLVPFLDDEPLIADVGGTVPGSSESTRTPRASAGAGRAPGPM